MGRPPLLIALAVALTCAVPAPGGAQTVSQRGFADLRVTLFPQETATDRVQVIADAMAREELFAKPAEWLQLAAGIDVRQNTHDQVEAAVDIRDRGARRPALSVRRLAATFARGPLSVDLGKQFIRWGKADIVTPTDRFAPRDFLNVIDTEFLGVSGARGSIQFGAQTVEVVWTLFTPSRVPLLNQRWAQTPAAAFDASPGTLQQTAPAIVFGTVEAIVPDGSQAGIRFSRMGGVEYSLSFFDGFNHLPNIELGPEPQPGSFHLVRRYPTMRSYGGDAAVPTRWFTLKGEAAYSTSDTPGTDDYMLYVVQLERLSGEWQFAGGYAGEVVTARRAAATFAPDRGLTRSIVVRAGYTLDSNRSIGVEGVVRQNGHGVYSKFEYSQARGEHWRGTITGVVIAGRRDDFLGQYDRNSHLALGLRYSF
jgi:hypothetical protein